MKVKQEICNAFNTHAVGYDKVAIVQHEIGTRLMERLDLLKIQPRYVLDLGCGNGMFAAQLKMRYPDAIVIELDMALQMLLNARENQAHLQQNLMVNADMMAMPFSSGVFDLVFSNQVIHWATSTIEKPFLQLLREIYRVMAVDGCFLFSTLGPDTFFELKQAWLSANQFAHVNQFTDMHDIGDDLLAEHYLSPVVDSEHLTLHYASVEQLLQSLKKQGVRNIDSKRNRGLTGKKSWYSFETAMQQFKTSDGYFPLTYEVIYGHAWRGRHVSAVEEGEVFFPINQLRTR